MKNTLETLSYDLNGIKNAAEKFWDIACNYKIIAFSGDMGAGKTTFIHNLCENLMVEDVVSSPTFALINEYHFIDTNKADTIIYHMDWYRLKNTEEAINAGMEDTLLQTLTKNVYCFIEWPEKAMELLPHNYLWVEIASPAREEREMKLIEIKKD